MTAQNTTNVHIVGVGTAALSTLDIIMREKLHGVCCIAVDSYAPAIGQSSAHEKILIGSGLGAGGNIGMVAASAQQSTDHIRAALRRASRIFLIAGFGGGTGTGVLPIIANMAWDCAPFVQCIVTMPFSFEGAMRRKIAQQGLAHLQTMTDHVTIIEADTVAEFIKTRTPEQDDTFTLLRRATAWKLLSHLY